MSNLFGPYVTAIDVFRAIEDHVRVWEQTYIQEVAAHHGIARGHMPPFASFVPSFDLDNFEEDMVPVCLIVVTGVPDGDFYKRGDGKLVGRWPIQVGAVVSGQDREDTFQIMATYGAAIRMMFLQHPTLEGFATGCEFVSERYDDSLLSHSESTRTLGAVGVGFTLEITDMVSSYDGPREPLADATTDPGPWPTVGEDKVFVTLEQGDPNG